MERVLGKNSHFYRKFRTKKGSKSEVGAGFPNSGGFPNQESLFRREITFAAEPVFHGVAELVERDCGADFHATVGDRESVVENRGVGEAAHGEVVQPLHGARVGLAAGFVVDLELA